MRGKQTTHRNAAKRPQKIMVFDPAKWSIDSNVSMLAVPRYAEKFSVDLENGRSDQY